MNILNKDGINIVDPFPLCLRAHRSPGFTFGLLKGGRQYAPAMSLEHPSFSPEDRRFAVKQNNNDAMLPVKIIAETLHSLLL